MLIKNQATQRETVSELSQKKLSKRQAASINNDMSAAHCDHSAHLTKRAFFKTSDADVCQDLVQTTFLKTLLYLRKGGKIETMRHFLNHVLNDLIVDEYRKRKTTSLDNLLEKGFEAGFDNQEQMINILDGKRVISLIPLLPEKYRTIMHMRYVQSLTHKEISLLTDQPPNTVAVQAHRGLEKIKVMYAETHT